MLLEFWGIPSCEQKPAWVQQPFTSEPEHGQKQLVKPTHCDQLGHVFFLLSCTQLQFSFLIPSSSSLWTHNIHFHLLQLPRGAAHEEAHAQEKPFWNTGICNFPTNTQAELIPPISYLFP